MAGEEFKELHKAIEKGDIQHVRHVLQNHAEEQYFPYEEASALYKAFSLEKYEVISYLIHKGAKVHDSEVYDLYRLDIDLIRVNYFLLNYNRKSEKSCIHRLISLSQSPQGLDGKRLTVVMSMYEDFFKSEVIKLLMKVLESETFDVVYDFCSDEVNRIHRLYEVEAEIYGLTLSNSKEIFIGAKDLLSGNPQTRAKVYGVVAEEFCHLALTTLFKNDAKPYREEDSELIQDFWNIVVSVKSLVDHSHPIESVIQDVFTYYEHYYWECELIARVPHVIGIYGEEYGRKIFQESFELSRVLLFYEDNVHGKCKRFTDPLLNTKPHRKMDQLLKKNDFISFKEKQIQPLKEAFPPFTEYLVNERGISVINTNCTKLCALQVYHELKREYKDLLEKKCLFFASECFEMKRYEILNALRGQVWEYIILILDKKELNLLIFEAEYLDYFDEVKSEGMKIIIILSCQYLGPKFENKILNYKWKDLTDEYKHFRTWPLEYIFKGEKQFIPINKEDVPNVFSEEEIIRIMSGELIVVNDGAEQHCQGYNTETYIERHFQAMSVDRNFFENLPSDTSIFIYDFCGREFQDFSIDEKLVQWLKGSNDEIQEGKSIFIFRDRRGMNVGDFRGRTHNKTNICLYHDNQVFYLRTSDSLSNDFKQYMKEITISEERMIDLVKSNKILIISDNAGCGKSTVTSSLTRFVNKNVCKSWVLRIDMSKFSMNEEDSHFEENIDEEEVFDDLFLMLGLNTGLEKYCFRNYSSQANCFIFLEAFDEIPLKYKTKAMTLISFMRKRTAVNMVVTTRRHHQQELEETLNTYSHKFVPFNTLTQVSYLQKLWKWKLKFPNGGGSQISQKDKKAVLQKIKNIIQELEKEKTKLEYHDLIHGLEKIEFRDSLDSVRSGIDNLDFTKLAENILDKTSIDKETLEFMGIPLHLYMTGVICFNSNFNVEIQSDIYCLYSSFIEQKVLIYVEEKEGFLKEGTQKENMKNEIRKKASRIHIELADQLMDEGKVCLASNLSQEDHEICSAIGIVYIYGGEVHFLHQTFAEFFTAESLRQKMQKDVFIKMVFEKKYTVVRRFLASGLKNEDFENITKEFFTDIDFLVSLMETIIESPPVNSMYEKNFNLFCFYKIVKKLLENFQIIDIKKDLVDKFINRLHTSVMKSIKLGKWSDEHISDSGVGGCLTAYMLKRLLTKNFNVYSRTLLSFVKHSENPHEVINVLEDYISIKTVGAWWFSGLFKRENSGGNKDSKADRLLEVLSLKDSDGNNLLFHALFNERAEMFAYLLKFFRDILGKEEFINAIAQSDEYKNQMIEFIERVHPNRICGLFKELQSIFGKEMEILLDNGDKFRVIDRAVYFDSKEKLSYSFERVTSEFSACFGKEELKELLLSKDSDGYYFVNKLIHMLMYMYSNRTFRKNLDLIKNILDDKDKMKQILKREGRHFRNIFHLAAKEDMYLDDLLLFCNSHLGKGEIMEMLCSADEYTKFVIQYLFLKNSSETLMKNLNFIRNFLEDNECFKYILRSKGKYLFHCAAANKNQINPSFLNFYLSESEISNLLTERNEYCKTCLHEAALYLKNLPVLFDYAGEILRLDRSHFEKLILGKDIFGNTFLHLLGKYYFGDNANAIHLINKIFKSMRDKLSDKLYNRLLRMRNKYGETFLQIYDNKFISIRIKNWKDILGEDLFNELLMKYNEVNKCMVL